MVKNNHKLEENKIPVSNIDAVIESFEEKTGHRVEVAEITVEVKTQQQPKKDDKA